MQNAIDNIKIRRKVSFNEEVEVISAEADGEDLQAGVLPS